MHPILSCFAATVIFGLVSSPGKTAAATSPSSETFPPPHIISWIGYSQEGGATLRILAQPDRSLWLQFSDAQTPWTNLLSGSTDASGQWIVTDLGAINVPLRFYRANFDQVYSVNAVGVIKQQILPGYDLLSNPLWTLTNTAAALFVAPSNGLSLFTVGPSGFIANNHLFGWTDPGMALTPGNGFIVRNPLLAPITLTFVGELPQGLLSNPINAGWSLKSSIKPQTGALQTGLNYPVADGDNVVLRSAGQDNWFNYYSDGFDEFWDPFEPILPVGKALWAFKSVPTIWNQTYSADLLGAAAAPGPTTFAAASGGAGQVNFFTYHDNASFGRVFDVDTMTPVGGAFRGQLFGGAISNETALVAIGAPVPFLSGPGAGYVNSGVLSVPGSSGGQTVYVQLRAWESAGGASHTEALTNGSKTGKSVIFPLIAAAHPDAGPGAPPPSANGFASFSLEAAPAAPSIVIPPQSQTVLAGSNVTFAVSASGTAPLCYQWYFNLTNALANSTNATLALTNVPVTAAGSYRVVVTNSLGAATSAVAQLTVIRIDTDGDGMPDDWELYYGLIPTDASDATMDTDGDGYTNLEEYLAGTDPQNSASSPPRIDTDGDGMPDDWELYYGLIPTDASDATLDPDGDGLINLEEYFARTDPRSAESWLRIDSADISGGNLLLSFHAVAGRSYTMEYSESPDIGGFWGAFEDIPASPTDWVVVVEDSIAAPGRFYRLVNPALPSPGAFGLSPVYSINMAGYINIPVNPGTNTLLVPFKTSDPTVASQVPQPPEGTELWKDGVFINYYFFGWDDPGMELNPGEYFGLYNPGSAFTLTFAGTTPPQPTILRQPFDRTQAEGGYLAFSASPFGYEPLWIRWQHNGVDIPEASGRFLTLNSVQFADAGSYTAIITNNYGAITSLVATLTVVSNTLAFVSEALLPNGNVELSFTSIPGRSYRVEYKNSLDDLLWTPLGSSLVAISSTLTIVDSPGADLSRFYRVYLLSSGVYSRNIAAYIHVQLPPGCTWLANPFNADDNSLGVLIPNPPDGTTVTKNQDFNEYFDDFGWADPAMLLLPGEPFELCNPSAAPFFVTFVGELTQAPVIWRPPTNTTVTAGSTATLCVEALSSAGLNYEWRFNGTPIPGADSRCLFITNVQPANAGNYSARVSNAFGSVTSVVAAMTIDLPPIACGPVNISALGNNVTLAWTGDCRLQSTVSLEIPNWTDVPGAVSPFILPASGNQQFFRTIALGGTNTSPNIVGYVKVMVPPDCTYLSNPLNAGDNAVGVLFPNPPDGISLLKGFDVNDYFDGFWTDPGMLLVPGEQFALCNFAGAPFLLTFVGEVMLPPIIWLPPTNTTVNIGSTALFCVEALSAAGLSYEWRFNGSAIPGANGQCLFVNNVQPTNAGNYSVRVSNSFGTATSTVASLAVRLGPVIAQQPTNVTVLQGQAAHFSVTAIGAPPLSYQWFSNNLSLTSVTATTSTLTVSTFLQLGQAGPYRVIVSNPYGTVTSGQAMLTVTGSPPFVISQPQNQLVIPGTNVTLTASIGGAFPRSYQWYFNGTNALPRGTNLSLLLTNIQPVSAGNYHLIVSNGYGTTSTVPAHIDVWRMFPVAGTNSRARDLHVVGNLAYVAAEFSGLHILDVSEPTNIVRVGGFDTPGEARAVQVVGPLAYVADGTNGLLILDVADPTRIQALGVGRFSPVGAGRFSFARGVRVVESRAYLTDRDVGGLAVFDVTDAADPILIGEFPLPPPFLAYASFEVDVHGSLAYVSGEGLFTALDVSNPAAIREIGRYTNRVEAPNLLGARAGKVVGSLAFVGGAILDVSNPADMRWLANVGYGFFSVQVQGDWLLTALGDFRVANISVPQTPVLTRTYAAPDFVWKAQVIGNSAYMAASFAGLVILKLDEFSPAAPVVIREPAGFSVSAGADVLLSVDVSGTPRLAYQWQLDGTNVLENEHVAGTTSAFLTIKQIHPSNAGSYRVIVSNSIGSVTSEVALVTVGAPPTVAAQPQSQTANQGLNAAFVVAAAGSAPLLYDWYRNGDVIPGAFGATLVVSNVQPALAGEYRAVIHNSFGAVTSAVAVLTVNTPRLFLEPGNPVFLENATNAITIRREFDTTGPLVVLLSSSSPADLSTPGSALIPAGQLSTTLQVSVANNALVQKPRTATLFASAAGFREASAMVTIQDDDIPGLSLQFVQNTISEGAGALATEGIVTRNPVGTHPLVVALESSDTTEAAVPASIVISAGEIATRFPIAAVDDALIDGSQSVIISTFALTSLTAERVGAGATNVLTVSDNDRPALTLTLGGDSLIEGSSLSGTLTRTGVTNTQITVTVSSSDTTEAVVAPSVILSNGQVSATFIVNGVNDGLLDGAQPVTITASATGYEPGSDSLVVSDRLLPDLTIGGFEIPFVAEAGARIALSYHVTNQGFAPVSQAFVQRVYASRDVIVGDDLLLAEVNTPPPLPAGPPLKQTVSVLLPSEPGDYRIIVVADATGAVEETVEHNNVAFSAAPIHVEPPYIVTVQSSVDVAPAGSPVELRGGATFVGTGEPAKFKPVSLYVFVRGTRRSLSTVTDSGGQFVAIFRPLPGEAGHYEVFAAPPGIRIPLSPALSPALSGGEGGAVAAAASLPTDQDEFDLLGLRFIPSTAAHLLYGLGSISNTVTLTNVSETNITGIAVGVADAPSSLQISITAPGSLSASNGAPVTYTIRSLADEAWSGEITLVLSNAVGMLGKLPVELVVEPLRPRLSADPGSLVAGALRGQQTLVQFQVRNNGGAETGPLAISLPALPWLHLASPSPMESLSPGASINVTLQLLPPTNAVFGDYRSALYISYSNTYLPVPFTFRVLSDAVGDVEVEAVDEYTYYAEGAPRLAGAAVTLTDAITGLVATNGLTGTNGFLSLPGIREGYYHLEVAADRHTPHRSTILIEPGRTNRVLAFLSRQTVQYTFTVEPILIDDHTHISVSTVFETFVPIPVITVDPVIIDLAQVTNDSSQVDITIANHGLVAAQDVRIGFQTHPCWEVVPLVNQFGTLDALSSITVPVLIRKLGAFDNPTNTCGPCSFGGLVSWRLPIGNADRPYTTPLWVINAAKVSCAPALPPPPPPSFVDFDPPPPPQGGPPSPPRPPPSQGSPPPPPVSCSTCDLIVTPPIPPDLSVRVGLRLDLNAVVARNAFKATLEMINPLPSVVAEIRVVIAVVDSRGAPATHLFSIRPVDLIGLSATDGTGLLFPNSTGRASWIIVPTSEAAPDGPQDYFVTGTLSFRQEGLFFPLRLAPAGITVLPNPHLVADFFHQRDVYSDDPFTLPVEPAVPFSLAVLLQNLGEGTAHTIRLTSPQPKIVSNADGLRIDFNLIGSQLGTQEVSTALTMNFGDLGPGGRAVGRWLFTSSLQGLFVDYSASFEHVDGLGDPRLSLFERVSIHEMIHLVRDDRPGADPLPDFLVNEFPDPLDLPDTLYLSDARIEPVTVITNGAFNSVPSSGNLRIRLTNDTPIGWTYFRLPDPGQGQFYLVGVERPDGGRLPTENFWLTDRTFLGSNQPPIREPILHLFDFNPTPTHTLVYSRFLDFIAPTSAVAALPAQSYPQIPVHWSGGDNPGGSGVAFYDLFVAVDGGPFAAWLEGTRATGAIFDGLVGHQYAFYSIATDHAGHREAIPSIPDAQTSVILSNRPPVLAAISNFTNSEMTVFTTAVMASDPDVPPQTLTYTLTQGPPGASIHPQTGVITWHTGEAHGDGAHLFQVTVADNGEPMFTDVASFLLFVLDLNTAPVLQPVPTVAVSVGETLSITNRAHDVDLPAQGLTFSLDTNVSPATARINPTNGILRWVPTPEYASTITAFRVIVTDDGHPSLMAIQDIAVIVNDYLAIGVGETVVFINQTGSVPVTVFSSAGVADLNFRLETQLDRLTNLVMTPIGNKLSSISRFPEGNAGYRFFLQTGPGRELLGTEQIAVLGFFALSNRSAFVRLQLKDIAARRSDGLLVPSVAGRDGRVVVIGREPLLEATITNQQRVVLLYGNPGSSYAVEHAPELPGGAVQNPPWSWLPGCVLLQTNQVQPVCDSLVETNATIFFRAVER